MKFGSLTFKGSYQILGIFFLYSVVLAQDGKFGPDPHHDGLIFTGAIAASQGLFPNLDFFSQYGPLTPLVQGFFLNFTSPGLYSLRIFMGLLSAFNGTIMYLILSKISSRIIGLLVSLIWILELSARIPWPSILSTTLILLAVLLALKISKAESGVTDSKARLLTSGFLLGISTFVRIHNVIFLILLCFFFAVRKFKKSSFLYTLIKGNIFGLALGLLFIFLNNSFSEFVLQCIVWPIFRYGSVEVNKSYLVGFGWFPLITILSILYFYTTDKFFSSKYMRKRIFAWLAYFAFWAIISISYTLPRDGFLSLQNPVVLFIDSSNNFVHFVGFMAVGIILFSTFKAAGRENRRDIVLFVLVISLGTLTQLYPLYDQVHLWFISPVLVVCAILYLQYFYDLSLNRKALITGLLPFILILGVRASHNWSSESEPFKSEILSGMQGSKNSVSQIDSTIKMLSVNLKGAKIVFNCNNGLYAAYSGKYESVNRNYVDWAPDFKSAAPGQKYFVCDLSTTDYEKQLLNSTEVAKVSYVSAGNAFYNAILLRK